MPTAGGPTARLWTATPRVLLARVVRARLGVQVRRDARQQRERVVVVVFVFFVLSYSESVPVCGGLLGLLTPGLRGGT
jgi:hypothetical protein